MVEGVHAGSHGPILHTAAELSKFTDAWNGIPVTIKHPMQNNIYVSANQPEVLETAVGQIFNTKFDNGKLKAQAWLELKKLEEISPLATAYIRQGKQLEVSVGVFTDEIPTEGTWNDEQYAATAANYRPDHLALLPGEQGACSWNDGCGIRVNEDVISNEQIKEDLVEVEQISFINVNKEGGNEMSNEKKTPCCLAKVEKLIAHSQTRFTDDDTAWLLEQEESRLDSLFPANDDAGNAKPPQVNAEEVISTYRKTLVTMNDFLNIMPADVKSKVEEGLSVHGTLRNGLIEKIQTNAKDIWTKEELEDMTINTLTKISKTIPEVVDYSGLGDGYQVNTTTEEVLLPAEVRHKNKGGK